MIFSKDHNFLLLKNGKVGGTALEVELSRVLPSNAIVTPATGNSPEWKIEGEFYDNYSPRNHKGFWNHMSYSEVKQRIDLKNVKSYIFVRNPYEIVLSHFFHRLYFVNKNLIWENLNEKEKDKLIKDYFNNDLGTPWHKSTKKLYIENEQVCIDKFLHYEKGIGFEINEVLSEHDIPNINLTVFSKQFKPKNVKYYEVFSQKDLNIIYDDWKWEFIKFGYQK